MQINREMANRNMSNEEAIEIISKNWPNEKKYPALCDALTLAMRSLKMTGKKDRKNREEQKIENKEAEENASGEV